MGYSLVKQPEPNLYRRVSCVAGVLRVSSKLGSSHRTLTTPVEAYAPPCRADILPFWRGSTNQHVSTLRPHGLRLSAFQPVSWSGNTVKRAAWLRDVPGWCSQPKSLKRHAS